MTRPVSPAPASEWKKETFAGLTTWRKRVGNRHGHVSQPGLYSDPRRWAWAVFCADCDVEIASGHGQSQRSAKYHADNKLHWGRFNIPACAEHQTNPQQPGIEKET